MTKYDDISIEVNGRYLWLPIVFITVGCLITVIVPSIHGLIYFAELYANYLEKMFVPNFVLLIYPIYAGVHILFASIYSLVGFAPNPKIKEENIEE
jgi:hypothetical protein